MELIPGRTLEEALRGDALDEREVLRLGLQMVHAGLRQQLGGTVHYEAHLQRAYKEAFKELEQLQAERKAKEERDSSTPASSADVT